MTLELSPVAEVAQRVATTASERRQQAINEIVNGLDARCRFHRRLLSHHRDTGLFAESVLAEVRLAAVALAQLEGDR